MIQIFTDTSANLPAAYIQKYSLRVIPLTYFVDGVEAHQDPAVDFDGKAYYDAMRSGTPVSTAMINLGAFLEPLHAALRTFSFTSTSICTVTETEFIHFAQHGFGTT